jgi:uncharacterized protein (DUF1800 family)
VTDEPPVRRRAAIAVVVLLAAAGLTAGAAPRASLTLPASPLTEDERALHALDRLGFGPRPGDVARVREMGVAAYVEQQLHPERLPLDAVRAALAPYDAVLDATPAELVRDYPQPTPDTRRKVASGALTRRELRERLQPGRRPGAVTAQLQAASLTRAVVSDAQLEEVLTAFWFNHFNVYSRKGAARWMVPAYERDAIRPHVLGRFRDLVLATARHPAMLFYLDNWLSTRADRGEPGANGRRASGLNENYARELMELHTLGVDGGYTQQDVTEVARCFTGWTIDRPRQGGAFLFRPRAHDPGSKQVLGERIPAGGGERDGERVIDILTRHPSTGRFIAAKLARHFVSDDPPAALVDRMAATFRTTDGDIRAVMTTLVTAPEFWSREAYRAKIKTPFEVVASAVRALGGRLTAAPGRAGAAPAGGGVALARQIGVLGQPLYEAQPPTGYPDRAESWVNTGALLGRMNFALALAHDRLAGVEVDLDALLRPADAARPGPLLDRLLAVILHGAATPETRRVLTAQLASAGNSRTIADDRVTGGTDVEKLTALVLGAPEFQRR